MSVEAELENSVQYSPLQRMRHSAAHVMAEAVQEMFPDAGSPSGQRLKTVFIMILICRDRSHQPIFPKSSNAWQKSSLGSIPLFVIIGRV